MRFPKNVAWLVNIALGRGGGTNSGWCMDTYGFFVTMRELLLMTLKKVIRSSAS